MPTDVHYLVPPGKIQCFVTRDLRADKPEEHVRQRWARSLVEEYGYPKSDLGIEVLVRMGRARKQADLVIYRHDAPHKQENIQIVIEAKREEIKPTDKNNGEEWLFSYMAACMNCRFGMWVGEERRAFEKIEGGKLERIPDIPRFGTDAPKRPTP